MTEELTLLILLTVGGVGWALAHWYRDWRIRSDLHRFTCTTYDRCPECRTQEPMSNFDRWDRGKP